MALNTEAEPLPVPRASSWARASWRSRTP